MRACPGTLILRAQPQYDTMSATYQIRVRGHLGEMMLQAFPGFEAESSGDCTILRGALPDQAALHGVLAQIEALGIELLELRQSPQSGSTSS